MNPPRPIIAGRCRRPLSGFRDPDASAAVILLDFLANHIMEDRVAPWRESQEADPIWQRRNDGEP